MERLLLGLGSRTVWAALVTVLATVLGFFGVNFGLEDQGQLVEGILALVAAVGGIAAIYFRVWPRVPIPTVVKLLPLVLLLGISSTACATGYARGGTVIVSAWGDAEVTTCAVEAPAPAPPPADGAPVAVPAGCTRVHGGSMSRAFAALIGGVLGVLIAP